MKHTDDLAHWLAKLESLRPKPIEFGLKRIRAVAERLALLKPWPYVITVAGTNGKGSCVALLEAIFRHAGKQVASYTSPHLVCFNERIKLNGMAIGDNQLCQAFAVIEQARGTSELSYFEFTTLAALWWFKQHALDVLLLEVGLGGRLDAVNCIDTDLAIISGVDFDHMDFLGHTREAIAYEKAGIIRPGKPLVYGDQPVPSSVLQQAERLNVPVYACGRDYHYQVQPTHWSWQGAHQTFNNIALPKLALQNVATILKAHELLPDSLQLAPDILLSCITELSLAGRYQKIALPNQAMVLLDVAHNPQSCHLLAERLQAEPVSGKTWAVVAMLADKDITGSLQTMLGKIDCWAVAGLKTKRGMTAEQMQEKLQALTEKSHGAYSSVLEAYHATQRQAKPNDRIVVFGSFHTVGEVLNYLHREVPSLC